MTASPFEHSINDYMDELEMGAALRRRVLEWYVVCKTLAGHELSEVFISDTWEGANRDYPYLCFFDSKFVFDVPSFVNQQNLRVFRLEDANWCHLQRINFDFKDATDESRLVAAIRYFPADMVLSMTASRSNCIRLVKLIKATFHFH